MIFFPAETTGHRAASTMTAPHCQTHATLSHPGTPQAAPGELSFQGVMAGGFQSPWPVTCGETTT